MRDIKIEVMVEYHNMDFERVLGKHYTSVNRLCNGDDAFDYNGVNVIAKRQFTGLKDINDAEIYEKDVVYLAGYGNYICEFPFLELYEAAMENDIGAILGDIYENPELLK